MFTGLLIGAALFSAFYIVSELTYPHHETKYKTMVCGYIAFATIGACIGHLLP